MMHAHITAEAAGLPRHPVNTTLPYVKPFFRNDDVAVDSHVEHFRDFCGIFHKHGFTQVHGVMLRGLGNETHMTDGVAASYAGYGSICTLPNARIRELSEPHRIADNPELVSYLNAIPDELALHGLYHTDYAAMTYEEQWADMRQGLEEMRALFPHKRVRYFIAPFNRHNDDTHRAAQALHLRVLYDDGVHLEEELDRLVLEAGIWYRHHHHRFYPETCHRRTPALSLVALQAALERAASGKAEGYLPIASEGLDLDVALFAALSEKHQLQPWHLNSNLGRRHRHELQVMSQWIMAHMDRDRRIFEVGCGGGNNMLWLAQHGYTQVRGSDKDPAAVALTNEYLGAQGMPPLACLADYLDTAPAQGPVDVLWASNCLYLIESFSLDIFLHTWAPCLAPRGCMVFDLVDTRYNAHPDNPWHSSDWNKPKAQRRPSEYKHRFAVEDVKKAAQAAGLHIVSAVELDQTICRTVFVLAWEGVSFSPRRQENPQRSRYLSIMPLIKKSGLFDRQWYIDQYVRGPLIMEPLVHYIRFGAAKGYNPSAHFNTLQYKNTHMQKNDATNPLLHYILNAKMEDNA